MEIIPGHSYWLIARHGLHVEFQGIPVNLTCDINVPLWYNTDTGNGWNMIAPPNAANYLWENIKIAVYDEEDGNIIFTPTSIGDLPKDNNYIDTRIWIFQDGRYKAYFPKDPRAVLMQNKGGWVRVKTDHIVDNIAIHLIFPSNAQLNLPESYLLDSTTGMDIGENKIISLYSPPPVMDVLDYDDTSKGSHIDSNGGCFILTLQKN